MESLSSLALINHEITKLNNIVGNLLLKHNSSANKHNSYTPTNLKKQRFYSSDKPMQKPRNIMKTHLHLGDWIHKMIEARKTPDKNKAPKQGYRSEGRNLNLTVKEYDSSLEKSFILPKITMTPNKRNINFGTNNNKSNKTINATMFLKPNNMQNNSFIDKTESFNLSEEQYLLSKTHESPKHYISPETAQHMFNVFLLWVLL